MFLEHKISMLELFLKNQTGIMMLEIQVCITRINNI